MPAFELDAMDLRILALLQADGRMSNQELAEQVHLSPSPCLRRVRRLEELGVIRQYVALLEPEHIGLGLLAYVNVRLEKHSQPQTGRKRGKTPQEDFAASVAVWDEVVACHAMTGEMDYLLRVHVADMPHFSRFMMENLLRHPSVVDVKSSFSLQKIKETTALPLR